MATPKNSRTKPCKHCAKNLYGRAKQPWKATYCNTACALAYRAEHGIPGARNQISCTCEQCGVGFTDKPSRADTRRFCSPTCRAAWQSALPHSAWRKKLSDNRANRARGPRNGMYGITPPHPKGGHDHIKPDGARITLRSTWEVGVARYLDHHGIAWEYEPRRFALGGRTYVPDFFLPALGVYWEVKGWFNARARETARLFRDLYPNETLVVITSSGYKMTGAAHV